MLQRFECLLGGGSPPVRAGRECIVEEGGRDKALLPQEPAEVAHVGSLLRSLVFRFATTWLLVASSGTLTWVCIKLWAGSAGQKT